MSKLKQKLAKPVITELRREIYRYQDLHADAYVKANSAEDDDKKKIADRQFDVTLAKLEALYELKGELRAKGFI